VKQHCEKKNRQIVARKTLFHFFYTIGRKCWKEVDW